MSVAVFEGRNPDTARPTAYRRRWAIVLAGGRGTRLSPLIRQWMGADTPKQFCTLTGSSSMLQQTVDRVPSVIPQEQIVIVIGPGQRQHLDQALHPCESVSIIEQTSDQGAAGAIFVAVCHILSRDPEATLLVLPSDHFLHPSDRFALLADRACQHAERIGGARAPWGEGESSGDRLRMDLYRDGRLRICPLLRWRCRPSGRFP